MAVYKPLLADAELGEDFAEDVVVGDFARDFAQGTQYVADLFGYQVGRQSLVEGAARFGQCGGSVAQAVVVTDVRYDAIAAENGRGIHAIGQPTGQPVDAVAVFGRKGQYNRRGNVGRQLGRGALGRIVAFVQEQGNLAVGVCRYGCPP